MPRATFPRKGFPLVPDALKPALQIEIPPETRSDCGCPEQVVLLSDLDESIWSWVSDNKVNVLLGLVTEAIQPTKLPAAVLQKALPWPDGLLDVDELTLEVGTAGAIKQFIQQQKLTKHSELGDFSLKQILNAKRLGKNRFLDLLCSLDTYQRQKQRKLAIAGRNNGWLSELPAELTEDPRYSSALGQALDESIRNENLMTKTSQVNSSEFSESATKAESALRKLLQAAVTRPLEDELRELAREFTTSERDANVAILRYGLDGRGERTLESIATELGINSRERVRQLSNEFEERIRGGKYNPVLNRVLQEIALLVPAPLPEIQAALMEKRLVRGMFAFQSLEKLASLLNLELPFLAVPWRGVTYLVSPNKAHSLAELDNCIKQELSLGHGVTNCESVCRRYNLTNSTDQSTVEEITAFLRKDAEFVWLSTDGNWFTERRRSALVNVIGKILSVSPKISLAHLRAGARRHHRLRDLAAPDEVIDALARTTFRLTEASGNLRVLEKLDQDAWLSASEQQVVRTLRALDNFAERETIEEKLTSLGVPKSSVYAYLRYSPILARVSKGVYCLRGSSNNPEEEAPDWELDALIAESGLELPEDDISQCDLINGFEPNPEELEALFADLRSKQDTRILCREGQGEFRISLLESYESTCAVTGCTVVELLEAAHIYPYSGPQSNLITNGILLRCDIHTLFDRELLAINPVTFEIQVHKSLVKSEYGKYAGKRLRLPKNVAAVPMQAYLRVRFERFVKQQTAIAGV